MMQCLVAYINMSFVLLSLDKSYEALKSQYFWGHIVVGLFYFIFSITPFKYSYILDFFKKYAEEVSFRAILVDSFMMITTCLLSSYFATLNLNLNIITMITIVYFIPYLIYMEY